MDSIVDLAESRKARNEKNEHVREASQELLALLDHHRRQLPESFLAFLMAMAVSDQAIQQADATGDRQAGEAFMQEVFTVSRQLYEAYYTTTGLPRSTAPRQRAERQASRVIPLMIEPEVMVESDSDDLE